MTLTLGHFLRRNRKELKMTHFSRGFLRVKVAAAIGHQQINIVYIILHDEVML